MSGPPPKRDAERRRKNAKAVETETVDIAALIRHEVDIPVAQEGWHPIAASWYNSLSKSGQSVFYEPSDWYTAYLLAEQLDRVLSPLPMVVGEGEDARVEWNVMPINGGTLTAILRGMTSLMVTEGDRRRLSIELERRGAAPVKEITNVSSERRSRLA